MRFVICVLVCILLSSCGAANSATVTPPAAVAPKLGDISLIISRGGDLWRFDLPAKQWTQLTNEAPNAYSTFPNIAPDGKSVVYSYRPPVPTPSAEQPFVVPVNHANQIAVDGGASKSLFVPDGGKRDGQQIYDSLDTPVWSPDGKTLYGVYQTLRFDNDGVFLQSGSSIVAIDVASGAQQTLVMTGTFPSVSPDGRQLAFVRTRDGIYPTLYLYDLQTKQERVLFDQPNLVSALEAPIWSADGKTIYIAASPLTISQRQPSWRDWFVKPASAHGLGWQVWSVDLATGQGKPVNSEIFEDPRIVVDGSLLYVWTFSGLWQMDLVGNPPVLIEEPGDIGGMTRVP